MTPVALVGPTASGKSALALAAARAVGGIELVSDRRHAGVPGHGHRHGQADAQPSGPRSPTTVSISSTPITSSPWPSSSVPWARRSPTSSARGVRGSVRRRHRALPPCRDRRSRAPRQLARDLRAEARGRTTTVAELHRSLAALDPVAAARMEPTNRRRIVRALEVCLGSGRPFSSFGPGSRCLPAQSLRPVRAAVGSDRAGGADRPIECTRCCSAACSVRPSAGRRRAVVAHRPSGPRAIASSSTTSRAAGRYDEAVEAIIVRTRQFAVRQDRWFRRDPRIRWIRVDVGPRCRGAPDPAGDTRSMIIADQAPRTRERLPGAAARLGRVDHRR